MVLWLLSRVSIAGADLGYGECRPRQCEAQAETDNQLGELNWACLKAKSENDCDVVNGFQYINYKGNKDPASRV